MNKETSVNSLHEITMADLPFHLEIALKTKNSLLIYSAPGVGKSQSVHDFCKEKHKTGAFKRHEPIEVRLAQHDVTDFKFPLVDRETKTLEWIVANIFPNEARDGKSGILFLDELTSAPPMIQTLAYALLLDRKIPSTSYKLPEGWVVVGAGNRENDQAIVHKLSSALCNRVNHLFIKPDWQAFQAWAGNHNITEEVVGFLSLRHHDFLYKYTSGQKAYPSPRTWEKTSDSLKVLKELKADISKVREQMVSWLGIEAGTAFTAYLEQCKNIPNPELVLTRKVKLPANDKIDQLFMIGQGVASLVQSNPSKWARQYMELLLDGLHEDIAIDSLRRVLSDATKSPEIVGAFKKEPRLFKQVATKYRAGLQALDLNGN